MKKNRNPNARPARGAESGRGRPLDPQSRRKWRLFIAIVVLAWLGGLLAARHWWPAADRPPEKRQVAELPPLPIPVLSSDLDPDYRDLVGEAQEAALRLMESFPHDAGASAVICGLLAGWTLRAGSDLNSPGLTALGRDKRADSLTSVLVLAGIASALLGAAWMEAWIRANSSRSKPSSTTSAQVRARGSVAPITARSLTVPAMASRPISPPGKKIGWMT